MRDYDLGSIEMGTDSAFDAYLQESDEELVVKAAAATPAPRIKIGSLQQLNGFQRLSANTLINKSTQDLWAIRAEADEFFIERLFDDSAIVTG